MNLYVFIEFAQIKLLLAKVQEYIHQKKHIISVTTQWDKEPLYHRVQVLKWINMSPHHFFLQYKIESKIWPFNGPKIPQNQLLKCIVEPLCVV